MEAAETDLRLAIQETIFGQTEQRSVYYLNGKIAESLPAAEQAGLSGGVHGKETLAERITN